MDSKFWSIGQSDFTEAVDSEIRSETESILEGSPVPSFGSVVDSFIRSSIASYLGASPVPSFGSAVDSAIRSKTASYLGPSRLHSLASSNWTGHNPAQLFSEAELRLATNNFSLENKIGVGSDAVMYRGKLRDGRMVAIKRSTTIVWYHHYAFKSELAFLSRLHHNNLVELVGFTNYKVDERVLVYEYMQNRSLHYHLHEYKGSSSSSVFNIWKMRIKIALDASRGVECLHNNVALSIVHRHIKSSNILLDATWTAKVSDFGMSSFNSLEFGNDDPSNKVDLRGPFGYSDPEYFRLNEITTKSDVYGFGVVLLELLTGKTDVFKSGKDIGTPLVNFALPAILAGELHKILDPKVGPPDVNEAEALKLVAYTAINCVNFKEDERPTMADIVLILEQALDICYRFPYDIISRDNVSMVYQENQ